MIRTIVRGMAALALGVAGAAQAQETPAQIWPAPQAPEIPAGRGYRPIPDVAEKLDPALTYKALFDATKGADAPEKRLAVLERVSLVLNGMALGGLPRGQRDMMVIFHGPSVDALLTNDRYRALHKIDNPNLELIAQLQRAGVRLLVCGQYMGGHNLPLGDLVAGVRVAEGATLVMIKAANAGYAVITD